jgi:hypothetical protein
VSNFWVTLISFDVEVVSPIPNASRAAAQVGRFTADGTDVALEEPEPRLLELRLLLLVSVVWQA